MEQDLNGKILSWNKGAESVYGYTRAEALKMNIKDLIPENQTDKSLKLFQGIRKNQKSKRPLKVKRRTKDGSTIDILLKATALYDGHCSPVGIATIEQNITGIPEECLNIGE